MTALSPEQAEHFERIFMALEQRRDDLQSNFKDAMAELREALGKIVEKDDVGPEAAGLRAAVQRLRDETSNPEKAAKSEAKADLTDQYYFLLKNRQTSDTARTLRPTREAA